MNTGLRIEFIGVGEAFDPVLGNSSTLVHSGIDQNTGRGTKLLIDCGYSVPRDLFSRYQSPELLDGVYFTHCHADHSFGFPALIGRLRNDGRTRPLSVIGQPGTAARLTEIYELAYPGSLAKAPFPIEFIEFDPAHPVLEWRNLHLAFAELDHPMRNFGIRITAGGVQAGISGDGSMTPQSRDLFSTVDLLVHEAFQFERQETDPAAGFGHSTVREVLDYVAASRSIRKAALVHIRRLERHKCRRKAVEYWSQIGGPGSESGASPVEIIIPEPGDSVPI